MSLVLPILSAQRFLEASGLGIVYLAFPRQVVALDPALVQGYEEVGAGVAVLEGEFGGGHFFSGCGWGMVC